MIELRLKRVCLGILLGVLILCGHPSEVVATNISEFIKITPSLEIEGVYDDNVFELSEDMPLPEDGEEREDMSMNARAGIGVDVTIERPLLSLGAGVDYTFVYTKYVENTELDDTQNHLDFEFDFSSKFEEEVGKDRFKLKLRNILALLPFDEEEPPLPGNQLLRNTLDAGVEYRLIATKRMTLALGYGYNRVDFFDIGDIDVTGVELEDSDELTQESQMHSGNANFEYLLNSKLTYLLSYSYGFADREENTGQLVSANFTRQQLLSGLSAKLTSRIHATAQAGYTMTSYDEVENASQDDQESFVVESSLTANFAHHPLMTVGYRRYYTENDFGDTLLTDNIFARVGIKIARGFIVSLSGDYIIEDRDLWDDENTQQIFGVNSEYQIMKNVSWLAEYSYRKREFFEQNFLVAGDREETTHSLSSGLQYKIGRYFLLKGLYTYTDASSNIASQEYSKNKFVASGKVIF